MQHSNTALSGKCVARVMKLTDYIVSRPLHEMYGCSLDWNVWATLQRGNSPFMVGLRGIFPLVQQFFRPQLGDGAIFRFWEDKWSGQGRLADIFPRLYALTPNPSATVQAAWTRAWTPTLPETLSDQRVDDLLNLQAKLEDLRPTVEERDTWIWRWAPFSAKAIYGCLRGQSITKDAQILRRCRIIWKRRLPLKIRLFAWLLLRKRLMTRTLRQRMYPDSPVNYPLYNGGLEDCDHHFFQCPLAQETWQSVNVDRLGITLTEAF